MLRIVTGLAIALLASGCVLMPHEPRERFDRGALAQAAKLPAVSYSCTNGPADHPSPTWPEPGLEALFARAFVQARAGAATDRPHIALSFPRLELEPRIAVYSGLLAVVSLGIVPFFDVGAFTLEARVERPGATTRTYSYSRSLHEWGWIPFALVSWTDWAERHSLERVRAELHEQMLLEFLRDLRRDVEALR